MCVSVYDLDDDRVGRLRPSAGSIVHTDYIIIVSEDEQCRKGGDTLERVRYTYFVTGHVYMAGK